MRRYMKARTSLNMKAILSDGDDLFAKDRGRQTKIAQLQNHHYKSESKCRSESAHHEATVGYIMKCNSSGTLLLMQKTAAAT